MKKILLIIAFLIASALVYSQNSKENTIITLGHYFNDDYSFSLGGRFCKDVYATYEHNYDFKTQLQSNYIGLGLKADKSIVFVKWGAKTEKEGTTHTNYTDYGIEYIWIFSKYEREFLYGLTLTKRNGVGFKLGLLF